MKEIITGIVIGIILGVGFMYFSQKSTFGNAITQGIVPQFSSASSVAVGPQQVKTVASKASNCTSRVISTASTSLMLSFGTLTPSATVGHWQGASTTVAYDNAEYGCGAITAYSSASSTVAVTNFIQ